MPASEAATRWRRRIRPPLQSGSTERVLTSVRLAMSQTTRNFPSGLIAVSSPKFEIGIGFVPAASAGTGPVRSMTQTRLSKSVTNPVLPSALIEQSPIASPMGRATDPRTVPVSSSKTVTLFVVLSATMPSDCPVAGPTNTRVTKNTERRNTSPHYDYLLTLTRRPIKTRWRKVLLMFASFSEHVAALGICWRRVTGSQGNMPQEDLPHGLDPARGVLFRVQGL